MSVSPSGPGSCPTDGAASASPPEASIPNADDPRLQRRQFGYGDSDARPRSISKQHRAMLSTFTDPIMDRIHAMTDDELWTFIEASQSVSMTNCGWDVYAIAKSYLEVAQWEMRTRLATGEAPNAPDIHP